MYSTLNQFKPFHIACLYKYHVYTFIYKTSENVIYNFQGICVTYTNASGLLGVKLSTNNKNNSGKHN